MVLQDTYHMRRQAGKTESRSVPGTRILATAHIAFRARGTLTPQDRSGMLCLAESYQTWMRAACSGRVFEDEGA